MTDCIIVGAIMYSFFYALPFYVVTLGMLWVAVRRQYPLIPFVLIMIAGRLGFVLGTWAGGGAHGRSTLFSVLFGLVAVVVAVRYLRFKHPILDLYALFLPLALALQRFGCLSAGCCYGTPTDSILGIRYLAHGPWVHPVPAYLIVGYVATWGILFAVRKRIAAPGALAMLGLALLSIVRFGTEFFRDTNSNQILAATIFGLKQLQWVSLLMALVFAGIFVFLVRRTREIGAAAQPIIDITNQQWKLACALAVAFVALFPILNRPEWFAMIPMLAIMACVVVMAVPVRNGVRGLLLLALGALGVIAATPEKIGWNFYGIVGATQGEITYPTQAEPNDCGGTYYSEYRSSQFTSGTLGARMAYENLRRVRFYSETQLEFLGGAYYTNPENLDWSLGGVKFRHNLNAGWFGIGAGAYSVEKPEKSVFTTEHIFGHIQLGDYRNAYLRAGIMDDAYGVLYMGVGGAVFEDRLRFELGVTDDGAYDKLSYQVSKRGHLLEFRGAIGGKHGTNDIISNSEIELKWLMPIGSAK